MVVLIWYQPIEQMSPQKTSRRSSLMHEKAGWKACLSRLKDI